MGSAGRQMNSESHEYHRSKYAAGPLPHGNCLIPWISFPLTRADELGEAIIVNAERDLVK
jgi:hypothetical protein